MRSERLSYRAWLVESESTPGEAYYVWADENGMHCTCPDSLHRRRPCKHIIHVVKEYFRDKLELFRASLSVVDDEEPGDGRGARQDV